MFLSDDEKNAGWISRDEIAYSPRIQLPDRVPHGICGGFDEWYVFEAPFDLGKLVRGNIFDAPLEPGLTSVFVNFGGFAFHDPGMQVLIDLFWKQLDWVQPESFIADGSPFLNFVSRNKDLFVVVRQALIDPDPASA